MANSSHQLVRCAWCGNDALYQRYHDREWGKPIHQDRRLFEFLILEGAQAGLSWITVLRKRPAYRVAFDQFDFNAISKYNDRRIQGLLENPGIIRNRLKICSAVTNAKAFIEVRNEFGTFDRYLWSFVNFKSVRNHWKTMADVPATSPVSDYLSQDLKKRGFKFVGSTICYAYMQAIGMVNDHLIGCYRHAQL